MDTPSAVHGGQMETPFNSYDHHQETNNFHAQIPKAEETSPENEFDKKAMQRKVRYYNIGLSFYFYFYLFLSFFLGTFVLLPEVVIPELEWPALILSFYLAFMALTNQICVMYFAKKSHFSPQKLDRLPTHNPTTGGWWYCKSCDMNCPPRSRHCVMCGVCVLKRDHHCFFAFGCIGFHNHRFFVSMCLYSTLGALYAAIITGLYLGPQYVYLVSEEWYAYLLPMVLYRWATGQATISVVGLYLFFCMSVFTCLGSAHFTVTQGILIVRGQTPIELKKKINTYRQTILENVHAVFGPAGPLNLIFPLFFLDTPGDGMSWNLDGSRVKAS